MTTAAPQAAPPDPADRRLWRAFARSVLFNIQAELIGNLIRIGGVVVLARQLQPRDFGLLRILLVLAAIAALTGTAGFPEALIQRKHLLDHHKTTAWWMTAGCAAVSALSMFAAAPFIERWMAMPSLGAMIRLICLPVFIEGSAAVPNALLQRGLRYDALAAADIIAEAGFVVCALTLLYCGYPRMSLPGGLAARAAARGASTWIAARFIPRGAPRLCALREIWPFAAGVLGGQSMVILSQNADYVMVGRLLGGRALGYYSMAWDLLRFIPERFYRVVGRVTLPAFSAIQDERDRLARGYCALTGTIARLLLPAMVILAIAAPRLIAAIYGAQWLGSSAPLRMLSAGLALIGLRLAIGSIYYARGWPALDVLLHGVRLLSILLAVAVAAPLGLIAVCAAMSAVEAAISIFAQLLVCRLTGLGFLKLCAALMPGLATAAACALPAMAGAVSGGLLTAGNWTGLVLILAPAAAVFCWRERAALRSLLGGPDLVSGAAQALEG